MALTNVSTGTLIDWALEDIAEDQRPTKKQAEALVDALLVNAAAGVAAGYRVNFSNYFKLEPKYSKAKPKREVFNPREGKKQMAAAKPAELSVKATALKKLKDAMPSLKSKKGKEVEALLA